MLRRIIALAIAPVLVHMNAARADLACARHAPDTRPAHGSTRGHDVMAHHAGHVPADAPRGCDTPIQADCCQALTTCSIAIDVAYGDDLHAVRPHECIATNADCVPVSRVTTPETPPPRA